MKYISYTLAVLTLATTVWGRPIPFPKEYFPVKAAKYLGRVEGANQFISSSATIGLANAPQDGYANFYTFNGKEYHPTACAAFQFAHPVYGNLNITYRHTDRVFLGDTCVGAYCGISPSFFVFVSLNGGNWSYVPFPDATRYFRTHAVYPVDSFKNALAFQQVVVCRGGGGHAKDNIELSDIRVRR